MLYEYRIGFGISFDKHGERIDKRDVDQALKIAGHDAADLFGGYSYWRCQGGWINPRGEHVHERGVQWSILCEPEQAADLRAWAHRLGHRLGQQAFVFIGPSGADIVDVEAGAGRFHPVSKGVEQAERA